MNMKNFNYFHRKLNDVLTVGIAGVIIYLFLMPWLPMLSWQLQSSEHIKAVSQQVSSYQVPDGHRLLIPKLGLDQEIYDGATAAELKKGVWRRPNTSIPPNYSNTVLAGHRFHYGGSTDAVFYHLDKIATGDKLYVAWENTMYTYDVSEIKVVNPTDVWVEDPSKDPRLTLYTCTPLWTSNQRLVIIADLEKEEKER